MAKDFMAKYNGDDVIFTVDESITCKRDTGYVFFKISVKELRLVLLIAKNEFRLNWLASRKMINVTIKSKHCDKIIASIIQMVEKK